MRKLMLTSIAVIGLAGGALAQTGAAPSPTAGGPATASPGAMPSQTPLTTTGAPRGGSTGTIPPGASAPGAATSVGTPGQPGSATLAAPGTTANPAGVTRHRATSAKATRTQRTARRRAPGDGSTGGATGTNRQ
jgi:hypothetical protein